MKKILPVIILVLILFLTFDASIVSSDYKSRKEYYLILEEASNIDWKLIATIDQFERNTRKYKGYCNMDNVLSFCIEPRLWSGLNNEVKDDNDIFRISHFMGFGLDGDNDGFANRLDQDDAAHSFIQYILLYGTDKESVFKALSDYYQSEKTMEVLEDIYTIISEFNTIELDKRVFPIAKGYRADYSDNFGAPRSFGGRRSHEGIDIFSRTYTPIVSTTYGVVDAVGWNRLGGYRVGIRDIYNTYEYYAHLHSYAKGLEEGMVVEPGQLIGYVGATGYGKEGTTGKFVPHLHFGLYKYDGKNEWSFNPYRFLKKWPKEKVLRK